MRLSRGGVVFAIGVAASLALAASMALAQSGRTTVLVGAGDGTTGLFLRDVQVRIASLNVAQYTDSMGQARFTKIRAGSYTIEARRLGYQPLSAPILVRSEDSLEVVMLMRAIPAQLDTVKVSRTAIAMHLGEFEARRQRGLGQFLTGAQIDSSPGASFTSILETHIHGVTATGDPVNGMHIMSYRQATENALAGGGAGPCWPVIYLDGVQLRDDTGQGPNLSLINIVSVGGIEFYTPSEVPVQYQSPGGLVHPSNGIRPSTRKGMPGDPYLTSATSPSCGVMLIWTRP
jgi:hypothetical protein